MGTRSRQTSESGWGHAGALAPIDVVLPMRSISGGKARLGGALDAEERQELVLGMLWHTLAVLGGWQGFRHIHLISPDPVLESASREAAARLGPLDLAFHAQPDEGLNEAVAQGIAAATDGHARSVLVLPGDLPQLTVEALDGMVIAADAGAVAAQGGSLVAIAPSDARSGTNALLLMPPGVISPRFGSDSFEAHLREAATVEAAVQVVSDPVLGFDLDTPEDLEHLDPTRLRELMALGREIVEAVDA